MSAEDHTSAEPYWTKRPNIAPIKPEYVNWSKSSAADLDDNTRADDVEGDGKRDKRKRDDRDSEGPPPTESTNVDTEAPEEKRVKLTKSQKKKRAIEEKRQHRKAHGSGMNRARAFVKSIDAGAIQLCSFTALENECERKMAEKGPTCKWSHDLGAYMAEKAADIHSLLGQELNTSVVEELKSASNESKPICPLFEAFGQCSFGYRCRFLSSHLKEVDEGTGFQGTRYRLSKDQAKIESVKGFWDRGIGNALAFETIRSIRKKNYPLPLTQAYLDSIGEPMDQRQLDPKGRPTPKPANPTKSELVNPTTSEPMIQPTTELVPVSEAVGDVQPADAPLERAPSSDTPKASVEDTTNQKSVSELKSLVEEPESESNPTNNSEPKKDVSVDLSPIRFAEKKRLHWRDKLYLAPLTTVGNLPYRRLCASLGAEITCAEMTLAQDLIVANTNEWSLTKRHSSERIFGVQIAGSRPQLLVPAAEIVAKELEVDFVDVNCGCPIDLVFKKGAGAALLDHAAKLSRSLIGMSKVLGEIPLTVKLRTGVAETRNTAHKIIPRLPSWGVGATTLHGRSRQQRYSKRADWHYISTCVRTLREAVEEEPDLPPIPIFGNGDCYDYREYYEDQEMSGVDGVMIARGALTKPWLFTEIKERRDWDISSRERLDQIGKLASFGLEHWGSDTQGVNTTRRFVCEALGFQYRYVPVGLLERLPARINDRPYPFKGRDELETLLASGSSQDWVKISSLFLGPPPDDWVFTPKHKSNAYEDEENG